MYLICNYKTICVEDMQFPSRKRMTASLAAFQDCFLHEPGLDL